MRLSYYPRSYYEEAVLAGRLRVNGQSVSPSHCIVDGQLLSHSVHRSARIDPPSLVTSAALAVGLHGTYLLAS